MTEEQIKSCLKKQFPKEIEECKFCPTIVGKLILMAFDSETLNLVNQKQCKDFEDYVREACRIQQPDWLITASLAKLMRIDMSKPKNNRFKTDFPYPW